MSNHKVTLALTMALLAPGGCTATETSGPENAPSAEARTCFFLSQVNGFNDAPDGEAGRDRIIVSVGAGEKYLFETFGSCPQLNWSEAIGFDQAGPGQICTGIDVDLIAPTGIGPQRCPVRMIRKLSQSQVDAM